MAQAEPRNAPSRSRSAGGPQGRADFDFFLGHWRVTARRLRRGSSGPRTWEPVSGITRVTAILDGAGNLDEDRFQLADGAYVGGMLRLFDAHRDLWVTYGLDRDGGALQPPLSGRFASGRGVFYGDDTEDGRPIRVRHLYFDRTPTSCRWEQAFSPDGGRRWETNWVIDFDRAPAPQDR